MKLRNAAVIFLLIITTAIPGSARARSINDALGKTSFAWLKAMPDAGIAATGECMSARDGEAGLLVHPAAIAGYDKKMLKLSYVAHYVDTQYGFIGYAGKYKDRYLGLKLTYVNYGEFTRTNKQGERTGTFSAGDMGLSFNIGNVLRDDLKVGATVSLLTSKIEEFSARAACVDVGVLYYPPFENLTIGAALLNMGKVVKSYSSGYSETLPVTFVAGARKKLSHAPITLMADVLFPNDNDITYAVGLEFNVRDTFYVRAGTKSRTDIDTEIMKAETDYSGITTFGFGLTLNRYRFSYSFCPDDMLEDVHKMTLGWEIR